MRNFFTVINAGPMGRSPLRLGGLACAPARASRSGLVETPVGWRELSGRAAATAGRSNNSDSDRLDQLANDVPRSLLPVRHCSGSGQSLP